MIHVQLTNDETGETFAYKGAAVTCIIVNPDDKVATVEIGISPGSSCMLLSDVLAARIREYVRAKTEAEIHDRTSEAAKPHIKRSDA